jgi:hypothetical protein
MTTLGYDPPRWAFLALYSRFWALSRKGGVYGPRGVLTVEVPNAVAPSHACIMSVFVVLGQECLERNQLQLSATDLLALASMKNAANCDMLM